MKTKQLISLCMAFLLIAALFAACSKTDDGETTTDAAESIVIDLNRVIGDGEEESRTVRTHETTKAEETSSLIVTTTAAATSTTAPVSTTAKTTTAPASTTAAVTTIAAQTTSAPTTAATTAAPTTAVTTTAVTTTKAPETTTAKQLSAVQNAWKKIASANDYVSRDEMIDALGGANNAYQTGSAKGCTNKLTPGSAYIYGDSASTNVQIITSLNPDEIIYEVDLKDNTYATPEGLSVGDSVLSAKQLYGTPDREEKDLLVYNQDKPYHMAISVNSNGIITGISLRAKDD